MRTIKKHIKNPFFFVIGLLFVFVSCAKLPQEDIDAAKNAVEETRALGAEIYAPENFATLQDSLNKAIEMVEGQRSKLFGNFDEVKTVLTSVTMYADEVKQFSELKKAEMKSQVQAMIDSTKMAVENNRQLLSVAPAGKEGAQALQAITAEVNAIDSTLNTAVALFDNEEYKASMAKLTVAKEKAMGINAELQTVVSKYKGKKRA